MNFKKSVVVALLLFSTISLPLAKKADRGQPIRIQAEESDASLQQNQEGNLTGNVDIQQGSLLIHADKAYLKQESNQDQIIKAWGSPATFQQELDSKNPKGQAEMLFARAQQITYNSKTGNVHLQGNAKLNIEGNTATGDNIYYNTITEKYRITANKKNRVNIIIYPKK